MVPIAVALKKVLLLDSNRRSCEMAALRLGILDMEVSRAASAGEALGMLEKGEPHLVVTEWPLAGGAEASLFERRLRSGRVPVVFCIAEMGNGNGLPAPSGAGYAHVPRLDRREMVQQAVRLLSETTLSSLGRGVGTPSARATRQILVIDDSQTFRGILRRTFEKAYPGDIVREAEDGRQALSQMTHQKVDLIVTDLEMPGMNGMTFLKHMKGNPILSKKPVLILSGTLSEELRIHAARMPNVRFLNKPARPERIIMELSLLGYD